MTSLTEALSAFIVETGFEDLPGAAVDRAKHHILDGLGVMLAGSLDPNAKPVMNHVRLLGGTPQAGVIGGRFRTSAPQAAFVNGFLGHSLDFDDDSDTMFSHPTVTILPAVMALLEERSSGKDLLTAYILGLEASARIAAIPGFLPDHYERGWHATSTLGVLSSVTGSAKILDLNFNQVRSAFGIAVSEAGGLRSNFGTMTKPVHAGSASAKGVTSALLAKLGVTANLNIFDCSKGFYELFGNMTTIDTSSVLDSLGREYIIVVPGMNIKKYPCCYYTHTAIDALLYLVEKHHLSQDNVSKIQCRISNFTSDVLHYDWPVNGNEAKFSIPFCLTIALMNRRVCIEDFQDEKVYDEKIREWMKRIKVIVDPTMNETKNKLGARLRVITTSGQFHTREVRKALGSAESPLHWEAVVSKFKACASQVLEENEVTKIIKDTEQMDKIETITKTLETLYKINY